MKFDQPAWLWALAILPVIFIFLSFDLRSRRKRFGSFVGSKVWAVVAPGLNWRARQLKMIIWLAALAMLMVALARPKWGSFQEKVHVSGLDLVFVLDVSNSMGVEDVVPSRLKKAKFFIRKIVENLGGDRVGLVAFAASSFLASPLTTDLDYLLETLDTVSPRTVLNQGTDLGIALETAANALDRGAEDREVVLNRDAPPSKAVVLISDGEDLEGRGKEGAKALDRVGAHLFVIGVGTEKGGPIPVVDNRGNSVGFKRDKKGEVVVSRFQPDSLEGLAKEARGKYWTLGTGTSEIQAILGAVGALDRTDYAERTVTIYKHRYQIPLLIAILLLLLEVSLPVRRLAAGGLLLALGGSFAHANDLEIYLENKKGIDAYNKEKIDEAKKHFGRAQALDPQSKELLFNQGVVQLESGDFDGASKVFGNTALDSLRKQDPSLAGKSLYNLGVTLEKKKKKEEAVQAYSNAIRAAQQSKDPKLEADARKRIEMLFQKKQKQKQQQQNQNQQDQQQQAKNNEQQKPDDKEQQNQNKDQKKQYSQGDKDQKKEFESKKLSKEDAERVMAELSNRERQLQLRLKKQQGKKKASALKDW